MRTHSTSRDTPHRMNPALIGADSRTSAPRSASIHVLNTAARSAQNRSLIRSTQTSPELRNEMAELQADIDGLPILVRLVVKDVPAAMQSDSVSGNADINKLLLSTLEKMVDRLRGSAVRNDDLSKQPLAVVELISSAEPLIRLQTQLNETVLRVGSLELDLVDRTAKRGDRKIDLRPREFQLLKYMMQRSDAFLTRATLFKEVWHYKFVPDTNLVDVHMGRLRRKVDGSNESPMIRNVRGVGFVLTATPLSQGSPARPV
jgi:DNA-binding winged helix-turn-helix (wHTH) protein